MSDRGKAKFETMNLLDKSFTAHQPEVPHDINLKTNIVPSGKQEPIKEYDPIKPVNKGLVEKGPLLNKVRNWFAKVPEAIKPVVERVKPETISGFSQRPYRPEGMGEALSAFGEKKSTAQRLGAEGLGGSSKLSPEIAQPKPVVANPDQPGRVRRFGRKVLGGTGLVGAGYIGRDWMSGAAQAGIKTDITEKGPVTQEISTAVKRAKKINKIQGDLTSE